MNQTLADIAYLIASVCFIMALRGLSSPVSAQSGNRFGMAGMVIAIATTLALPGMVALSYPEILAGIVVGGGIGTLIARTIKMTALPQLVAAFHSLVGLAAFFAPQNFGIGEPGHIHPGSLVEMGLGLAIGAITFTGSLIAFGKLQALLSGAPLSFPFQHQINAALGVIIVLLIVWLVIGQP